MTYDSKPETLKHIEKVRTYLDLIILDLKERALKHDASKLKEPEVRWYRNKLVRVIKNRGSLNIYR